MGAAFYAVQNATMKGIGVKENLGSFYDKTSDFQQQQFLALCGLIQETVPQAGGFKTMLDIGSGSGTRTRQCLDIFKGLEKITAIEPDWEMIEVAKSEYADPRIEYKKLAAEQLSALQQNNHLFDAVISNWAVHWVSDKEKMMQDLNALTHPGSVLMLSTCEVLPSVLTMIDSYVRNEFKITPGNSPFFYLNAAEWKDLMARHGWEVSAVKAYTVYRDVEDTQKYLEHWFTASAAKFMYGKHLVELSPWAHSDLIWMMGRAFPCRQYENGLSFSEDVMFLTARRK